MTGIVFLNLGISLWGAVFGTKVAIFVIFLRFCFGLALELGGMSRSKNGANALMPRCEFSGAQDAVLCVVICGFVRFRVRVLRF